MFKCLTRLFFILIILVSLLSVNPVFAKKDNPQEVIADFQKTQVRIEAGISYREGYYAYRKGTGTVIAKEIEEVEVYGQTMKDTVYFIHSNPHVVHTIEKLLEDYKEARIRIYIFGKDDKQREAEIVAWNWGTAGLLLRAVIPSHDLENFKFKVARIGDELPISSIEQQFSSDLLADTVYPGGYPLLELADSEGKVSRYGYNENFPAPQGYEFQLLKTMHIPVKGLVGRGQSGGGVFMVNKKTGKPEWVGTVTLRGDQLVIGVPIDVTVENFLKQVPALKELIDFPKFKLNHLIEEAGTTVIHKDFQKEEDNN